MNYNSRQTGIFYVESPLAPFSPNEKFQFELQEYFVADRADHVWVNPCLIRRQG